MWVRIENEQIEGNPFQVRVALGGIEELADSILALRGARPETSGLLQVPPARLWDVGADVPLAFEYLDGGELVDLVDGDLVKVQLAAGHRRLAAFRHLHESGHSEYATFPVELEVLSDEQMADVAWAENADREDLSAIEEAESIKRAMERFGWTQQQIADRWRLSRPGVGNLVRLLNLPEEAQGAIRDGTITQRHGRVLLSAMGKSPAIYRKVAARMLPSEQVEGDALEKARELAPGHDQIDVSRISEKDRVCKACGKAITTDEEIAYHDYKWIAGGGQDTYLCKACHRAATNWTPPSVADAESAEREAVSSEVSNLDPDTFPLDVGVGEGDPGIQAVKCVDCEYRRTKGEQEQCLMAACFELKEEYWKGYLISSFVERLRVTFGEIAPVEWDGYNGVTLASYEDADTGRVGDGTCAPGTCERLFFRRRKYGSERDVRPFADLPFVYVCNNRSSYDACARRWREAQRTEEEREAEKEAEKRKKENQLLGKRIEERGMTLIAGALLEGQEKVWERVARRMYCIRGEGNHQDFRALVAKEILTGRTYMTYDWGKDGSVASFEEDVRKELKKLGLELVTA